MKTKSDKLVKWWFLLLGGFMVWNSPRLISKPGVSILDYEGLDLMTLVSLLMGFSMIMLATFLFWIKDDISGPSRVLLSRLCAIIVLPGFAFWFVEDDFKYKLPLQKIETDVVEGVITHKLKAMPSSYQSERIEPYIGTFNVVDYPNISFSYPHSYRLKNEIVNMDENYKEEWPKGTKVKMKVRKKALNNLLAFVESGDHLDTLSATADDEAYNKYYRNPNRSIDYYELYVDEKLIVKKFGLK